MQTDPTTIASCSIDTTCTIWDIVQMTPKTQLIAHDKEVFDVAFAWGKDIFGTVGADGSLRMFDLRSLEHSTIIYETPDLSPLLKIVWNKQDPNYLCTIQTEGKKTIILDVRVPSIPVVELYGHHSSINGAAWAPHSPNHICTCGDDRQALIWDVASTRQNNLNVMGGGLSDGGVMEEPILAYSADSEINQLQWCSSHEDWIGICFNNSVSVLMV